MDFGQKAQSNVTTNIEFSRKAAQEALTCVINEIGDIPHIVSVGCGLARTEIWLAHHFNFAPNKLILVDPAPMSTATRGDHLTREMDYAYTSDLIKARPEVVSNCVLILWNSNPDWDAYDVEAIHALNPKFILISYEANFTAGSLIMQAWLRTLGLNGDIAYPSGMLPRPERWFPAQNSYEVVFERNRTQNDEYGLGRMRVALLRSKCVATSLCKAPDFELFAREFAKDIKQQRLLTLAIQLLPIKTISL